MKHCKHCGREVKQGEATWWYSTDYCSRTCAALEARELKEKYWDIVRLLKEKK